MLRASSVDELSSAVIAVGDYAVGADAATKNDQRLAITRRLAGGVQRIRMHGSAAIDLAWLAAGRIDGVVTLANNLWDVAAGVVIAQEAGAIVTDFNGRPHSTASDSTIGAAPGVVERLLELVRG